MQRLTATLIAVITLTSASTIMAAPVGNYRQIQGDVNVDGKVNQADMDCLRDYIYRGAPAPSHQVDTLDVNDDGRINVDDMNALRQILAAGRQTPPATRVEFKRGDLNGDDKIDMTDIRLLHHFLNGSSISEPLDAADVNADGRIDMQDYDLLVHAVRVNP